MSDEAPKYCADLDGLVVSARSDRAAFGRLYDHYYDPILRYCLRRLGQRAAAEDVCGDVFLYVARKIRTFSGATECDFRRWVYRIATTEINASLRRARRRNALWADAVTQKRLSTFADRGHGRPAEASDWECIQQAIAELSLREQTVVVLRLNEGMTHDEIAQVLRIRSGAARVAYSRAIQKLRELLLPLLGGTEH